MFFGPLGLEMQKNYDFEIKEFKASLIQTLFTKCQYDLKMAQLIQYWHDSTFY